MPPVIHRNDEVHMGNCFKVFAHGRLFAIVRSEGNAEAIVYTMASDGNVDPYYIALAYVPDCGF